MRVPFTLAAILCASAAQGQSADLPAAPASQKPSFVLPPSSLIPARSATTTPQVVSPEKPAVAEMCSAPAEGLYAPRPKLSPELEKVRQKYVYSVDDQLSLMWRQHMPRALNDPWVKSATVTTRFAILPDGSIDGPLVTVSSGRKAYDKHAVDAIQQASPFNPLPDGITRAVAICFRFGYNENPGKQPVKPWDYQPPVKTADHP